MRSHRLSRLASLSFAAFVFAACGDGTGPGTASVDDLIRASDEASAFGVTGVALGGGVVPQAASHSGGCSFNSTSQSFVCPGRVSDNLTFSRSFQLLDASGTPQSAFNPATTAAIRTIMDVSGTRTLSNPSGPGATIAFEHHADHTLSGLLTGPKTLNGVATSEATFTPQGGSSYVVSTEQTIDDLVLPERGESHFPKSGSITTEVTVPGFLGVGTHTSTVAMEFDGTSVVHLTITSGGATRNCTIDLSKHGAPPVCA